MGFRNILDTDRHDLPPRFACQVQCSCGKKFVSSDAQVAWNAYLAHQRNFTPDERAIEMMHGPSPSGGPSGPATS